MKKKAADPAPVDDGKAPCRGCKGPGGFRQRFAIIAIPARPDLPTFDIWHPTCVGSWLTSNEGLGVALRFFPGET